MEGNIRFLNEVRSFAENIGQKTSFKFSEEDNAYIFDGNIDTFECPSCQELVSYGECDCGTLWYVYHIVENDMVKTIARKIQKDEIILKVASREEFELF